MARSSRISELTGGVSRSISQLSSDSNYTDNPRSYDSVANKPFIVQRQDYDRETPPTDEMSKYWLQYESTPIVRKPINAFSNRIVQPGYYLDYPESVDQEKVDELYTWLENCATIEGEEDQDIYFLLKKAMVQREVRGTAIIEKVYAKEDRDVLMGMKMLHPETIEANTRPGQAILLKPEDADKDDWDPPLTPEGEAAAYLQDLSDTQVSWGRSERVRRVGAGPDGDTRYPNRIGFAKDDIIKFNRDADAGEIFGTSRVESVSDRIEGLKQKLQDNDEAIASKAYPLWLFRFGVGDDASPWSRNDIDEFMGHHEMDAFHPGMKQGVRGDVEIETISGEVADIAESLNFDLDWILAAMPMARQALGGFSGGTGSAAEVTGMAQEQNIVRQLEDTRKELSHKLTPTIQEKAENLDIDEELIENIKFKVGDPSEEVGDEAPDVSTSKIEYHGVGNSGDDTDGKQSGDGNTDKSQDVDAPPEQLPPNGGQEDPPTNADIGPFGDRRGVVRPDPDNLSEASELSVSQLTEYEDELDSLITETATEARETILDDTARSYENSPQQAAYQFAEHANEHIDRVTDRNLRDDVEDILRKELMELEHTREYSVDFDKRLEMFADDIVSSAYNMLDDMIADMQVQLKRAAHDEDMWAIVRSRISNLWNDSDIESRAQIIATMELHNARESMKLATYDDTNNIIGVRVHNPDSSTAVCEDAHGVEAYFDAGSIGSQLREQTDSEHYHEDFDPLPASPPYHFGCDTVLEPIYEDSGEK